MPIDAVKIPQNVQIEDHIIGPVSLRQLTITGIGGGISYMLYSSALKAGVGNIVFLGACWLPAAIAAAFSFLKINDLSLLNIIFLMVEGMQKPKERYWSPHPGLSINLITGQAAKEISEANTKMITKATRLANITREMEERQKAMTRLAEHGEPTPDDLEPIKMQLQRIQSDRARLETVQKSSHGMNTENDAMLPPVDSSNVEAGGLDPMRSIDSIVDEIGAHDRLATAQHS